MRFSNGYVCSMHFVYSKSIPILGKMLSRCTCGNKKILKSYVKSVAHFFLLTFCKGFTVRFERPLSTECVCVCVHTLSFTLCKWKDKKKKKNHIENTFATGAIQKYIESALKKCIFSYSSVYSAHTIQKSISEKELNLKLYCDMKRWQ